MKLYNSKTPLGLALVASIGLSSCSDSEDERASSSSQVSFSDLETTEVALGATVDESLDILSDSNLSISESGLGLAAGTQEMTVERSCSAADGKAVVTIQREKSRSISKEGRRYSFADEMSMKSKVLRTWSKDGSELACTASGKSAAIDFEADLSGYKLEVAVDRTHNRKSIRTNSKSGETVSSTFDASVKGSRQVSWLSQSSDADGQLKRKKSISFSTERAATATLKSGKTTALSLKLETAADKPLLVEVTWAKESENRTLLGKFIESGTIKATQAGAGSIETSFSDVSLSFTADSCTFSSGTIEAKVFAEGATEASKTYKITAADGELTMSDTTDPAAPKEVEDFSYSPCDLKDFNF